MSPAALACTTLLLDAAPSAAALRAALPAGSPAASGPPASAAALWMSGLHAVVVDLPGGVRARVDLLAAPWPDGLGVGGPPALAAAVAAGAFGPPPAPGALARAAVHSPGLPAGAAAAHQAVLRLRALPRAGGPPPRVVQAALAALALQLGRALAPLSPLLFHPGGELLLDLPAAEAAAALIAGPVPLALIAGLRVLRVGDPAGWAVVDSVGHGLLGVPDVEVAFMPGMTSRMGRRTRAEADPSAIAAFARELGLYLLGRGDVLLDGHFLEGPGSRYRVHRPSAPLLGPDRAVIRLLPVDGPPLPALLDDGWRAPAAAPGPALRPALDDAALQPAPFGAGQGEGLNEDDVPDAKVEQLPPPIGAAPTAASRAPGGRRGGAAGRGSARGPGPGGAAPAANPRAAPGRGARGPARRPAAALPEPDPLDPEVEAEADLEADLALYRLVAALDADAPVARRAPRTDGEPS
ncbi:MAG: hypothetical protein JNM72_25680 [Deltaproteobacteria bacterium]|nr:hypothetical protein [Deltaproteobacteria bacterium]